MDAAGEEGWQSTMLAQGKLVRDQQQCLGVLDAKINLLTNTLSQTLASHHSSSTLSTSLISCPKKFSGETVQWKGFLLQCSLYLSGQVNLPDLQKIAQVHSLLTGKALRWASAV